MTDLRALAATIASALWSATQDPAEWQATESAVLKVLLAHLDTPPAAAEKTDWRKLASELDEELFAISPRGKTSVIEHWLIDHFGQQGK